MSTTVNGVTHSAPRSAPWRAISAALALLGFAPGPISEAAGGIDREACASMPCERCGHAGLAYRAAHKRPSRYVAYGVCEACGHVNEM